MNCRETGTRLRAVGLDSWSRAWGHFCSVQVRGRATPLAEVGVFAREGDRMLAPTWHAAIGLD